MDMSFGVRATLGVVSPSVVASMEQRIAQNQQAVAQEVAKEAAGLIATWNSRHYGPNGYISKDQAISEVKAALSAVLKRRAKG